MANITILEALNRSLTATKKYVDGKVENMPYTIEKNIVLQIPQSSITRTSYRAEFPIFEYDSNKRYIINYNNEEHELYQYPGNLSSPNGSTIKGPTLLCELNSGKKIRIRLGSALAGADDTKLYIEVGEIATTDLVLVEYSVKTLDNKYIPKHFESLLSISLGRKKGTTIGLYSSVLGYNSEATNYYAHAEGEFTTASGESSHAEGSSTVASGEYSHAEGSVAKAIGDISHAEGYYTKASGSCSHAEGSNTEAIGMYSHVEGSETITKGRNSHAEGYSTIASGEYQHVQGKYNIEDKTNTYVHIVGNGTSDRAKSNAHTLDWQGNGWYAGKLSQDGVPTEDKDLVTKKYVDEKFLPNSAIHTMTLKLNTNEVNFIQSMETNNYNNPLEHITKGDLSSIIDNSIETIIFEGLERYPYKVVGAYRGFSNNERVLLELAIGDSSENYYAVHRLKINYSDDFSGCFLSSFYGDFGKINALNVDNTIEYEPTGDYNPATKKYVDDKVAEANASGGYTHPDSHPASMITGLATVATSGSYNDLNDKPTIPSIEGLATETYVNNKVSGLVDSAPEALNTLNELATALGNDANFATTISNQIGLKANSADLATVATSGSYNDLTNRPIKVLPDDTTVADLYNLEMGIYLLTNNIEFNITDDTNMENGVVFNKFSPFTLIIYRGNGMVGDLSSNIYYVFTSDGSLISAGTTDNSWAGTIATVATTGSYNDLTDKPTIPTVYTHPATHPASMITGLSTVATSGSYADLTNKPTIPTVTNDLTNALKSNYDKAYTHSQSTHAPSNAQKNSDITKAEIEAKLIGNITTHTHSQYLTEHQSLEGYVKTTDLSTVATTGSYNDLTDKPTIPSAYTHPSTHPASMITGLSKVATSGSYNDLSNKPTIPTIPNSLPANGGNADTVNNFRLWKGTQAQYDAITTKDSNTIYMITE